MGSSPINFTGFGEGKNLNRGLGQQSGFLSGLTNSAVGQRNKESAALFPGYSSLLNSGYSDAEKSAINQNTLGAINSSYGGAQDSAARRMARTGNSAGFASLTSNLARNKSKDLASQNLQNQKDFADETLRRKMLGLQGIAGLYGIDTSFLNSLNSQQNQLLGYGTNEYGIAKGHPGFLDSLSSSLGSGLGQLLTLH